MKKIKLLKLYCSFIFLVPFSFSEAQDTTGRTCIATTFCNFGSLELKQFSNVLMVPDKIYYGLTTEPATFSDVFYQLNQCKTPSCPLDLVNTQDDCIHDQRALYYYVYYPADYGNQNYISCPLPALIMFHQGGYSECSSAELIAVQAVCKDMAARGFVVFDVNYRVGVIPDPGNYPNSGGTRSPVDQYVSVQQLLAIYRACQDARGAIRTIIQNNATTAPYKINTNKIFLGGLSAGSVIALNAAYDQYQTAMIDQVFPNVKASLGNINPPYYAAVAPSSIDDDYYSKVQGVLNMWGSMFIPTADLSDPWNFISKAKYKPPIISIAGVQDATFNIFNQPVWFSINDPNAKITICVSQPAFTNNFGLENRCLPGVSPYLTIQGDPETQPDKFHISQQTIGSETIFNALNTHQIFAELYLDCEMGHGLDNDDMTCGTCANSTNPFKKPGGQPNSCAICSYRSNFGTANNSAETTFDYLASRAATFFQAILTNTTGYVTVKKFVEIQNPYYDYCKYNTDPNIQGTNQCDLNHQPN